MSSDTTAIFCEIRGTAPGDIDDLTGYRATFHIELISDNNCGGKDELSNLRTLCSTCNRREEHHGRKALGNMALIPSSAGGSGKNSVRS